MNTNSSIITGITTHDNRDKKGLFSNMMKYVSTTASNVVSGLTGVMSGATTEAKEIIHSPETTTYNTSSNVLSAGGKKSKKMRKSNKSKKGKRVRKTRKTKGHSNKRSGKRHRRKMGSSRR